MKKEVVRGWMYSRFLDLLSKILCYNDLFYIISNKMDHDEATKLYGSGDADVFDGHYIFDIHRDQ